MKIIAKMIKRLLNMPKGQYDTRVCETLSLIVRIRRKLDYRSLSGYFQENNDEAKRCELQKLGYVAPTADNFRNRPQSPAKDYHVDRQHECKQ